MMSSNHASKKDTISIATYNIYLWSDESIVSDNILELQRTGVDIFCLQEILKISGKPFIGDLIIEKLGKEWEIEYLLGDTNTYMDHGLAIVWNERKIKKIQASRISLPQHGKVSLFFKLIKYITGFTHKEPSQRKALSIVFNTNKKRFQVITTHIDIVGGSEHRLTQHQAIKDQLLLPNVKYQIICGDFNTVGIDNKKELKKIREIYGKEFFEADSEISWTQDFYYVPLAFKWLSKIVKFIHFHIKQKLDHIFIRAFTLKEIKRIDIKGSDHFPIIAKLEF